MSSLARESDFPVDYRQAQVRQIMRAVYRLRSIAVTGLAGMGKSNLARFIVSHPEARAHYLEERAKDFAFVYVDGAGWSRGDEAEILDELVAQLERAGAVDSPARPREDPPDSRRRVKEHLLRIEPRLNLVVVFDYFDAAAAHLDASFYNFLFHLRNARPRGNLSYIFVSRRSPRNLYELQELLDDDCTVGPLVPRDALESLRRDEARLGCIFDGVQRERLIECTGGHPGLLKNAAELLADGRVEASKTPEEIAQQLLGSQKVTSLCRELWDDFTAAEREVLTRVARALAWDRSAENEAACLERNGILVRKGAGETSTAASIFCPLFKLFVGDQIATASPVRITAVFPNQAHIETVVGAETVTLSPKLFALLKVFVDAGGQVLRNDDLIALLYGTEAVGVTDAALSQLVRRLRDALDPRVRKLMDDPTYTCVETVRDVGYRFNR